VDTDALAEVRGPGWSRLLARARRRLEASGGVAAGSVGLSDPSDDERRVVIGITGRHRPPTVGRLAVQLSDVDGWLRRAYGMGLADVLARLGPPLRDRPAERTAEQAARAAMRDAVLSGRYGGQPWCREWLDRLDRDGTLTKLARRAGGADEMRRAVAVLDALPADAVPLPVLAERVCGDTKALAGTPVASMVLRAVAGWRDLPATGGAAAQRRLWDAVGVIVDDLASQALVLNLPATSGLLGQWLAGAAGAGIPFRVTLQQLIAAPVAIRAPVVYVCENPAVLRTAAEALGPRSAPLLCTEGVGSVACRVLLAAARAGGAEVRWRNDFDWPGLRMTGAAVVEHGAVPWRMGAADYRAALSRAPGAGPLAGSPAASAWDPDLADAMRAEGRAVMEERLVEELVADLAAG
jgi:uncharacterized protein (TIGR02679 family)